LLRIKDWSTRERETALVSFKKEHLDVCGLVPDVICSTALDRAHAHGLMGTEGSGPERATGEQHRHRCVVKDRW